MVGEKNGRKEQSPCLLEDGSKGERVLDRVTPCVE